MKKVFIEVVFEGHFNTIKGFIEGFQAGMGSSHSYFFSSDSAVDSETFAEHIRDWISLGNKLHHVIMEEELFEKINGSITDGDGSYLLTRASRRSAKPVKAASFTFRFIAYGRKYAGEIKEILGRLPEGVTLSDYLPIEKIDEECSGVELYTTCHDYLFQGKGVLSGAVEEIIPLRKTLYDHPLIEADKVTLVF